MRKFIFNSIYIFFISFIILNLYGLLLIKNYKIVGLIENSQIYSSIKKIFQDNSQTKTFVFGDSVGNQMYYCDEYQNEINSFCAVMPMTLAGQYLMIKELSEHQNLKNKRVVLLYSPMAFLSEIDNKSSIHYILKPFYNSTFKSSFDHYLLERIKSPLLCYLTQLPIIKLSNYYNSNDWIPFLREVENENKYFSKTSIHYLKEIKKLSIEKGFEFLIKPTFQSNKRKINSIEFNKEITDNDLNDILLDYTEQIVYKESELFESDDVHFKNYKLIEKNCLNL